LQLFDKSKTRYLNLPSSEKNAVFAQGKPEIDRVQLRKLLLDKLPPDTIKWGFKFLSLTPTTSPGEISLQFEHGIEAGYDLIVGADGAFSKVRSALTDTKVEYSRIGGFTASIFDAEAKYPAVYKLVRRGSVFAFGEGKELIAQQMGDGRLSVTVWLRKDSSNWQQELGFDIHNGESVLQGLKEMFGGWDPELLAILEAVDLGSIEARSLFHLPIGERWESKRGVTLIGDAAHLMTPFVGEGVNAAMRDSLDLAHHIIASINQGQKKEEILDGIGNSEELMMKRVERVQRKTEDMKNLMLFTDGSPRSTIERYILRSMSDEVNSLVLAVVKMAVYSYFFFFKLFHKR
jgi:2-polyprenyl-6-methoxyphenol hydroxylase-like FAD-dependent oxidoreductase